MRILIVPVLAIAFVLPVSAQTCSSIVVSVCMASTTTEQQPAHKLLTVEAAVQAYAIGEHFPIESRSLLMDPVRYSLKPSDGKWRYYAMNGVVYRVVSATGEVLEVIRNRRVAHLR
jgi:hypothetical protein